MIDEDLKTIMAEQSKEILRIRKSYNLIKMEEEIFDQLDEDYDFTKLKKVNVMVSSGSDSMALLFLIRKFIIYKNDVFRHLTFVNKDIKDIDRLDRIELNAIYVHFKDFDNYELALMNINNFCLRNCIDLTIKESVITKDFNDNVKSTAREEMKKFAVENKPDIVFTGHHKDDNIETILYRILSGRGGITGFEGMKRKDYQKHFNHECYFGKPFLNLTKRDILNYCKCFSIPYVEDDTNYKLDSDRNFIRNRIIPVIQERFNINNIFKISERMNWFLENSRILDLNKDKWELEEFRKCGISIQTDAILYKCKKLGYPISNEKVKRLVRFLNHEFKTTNKDTGVFNIAEYKDSILLLIWNKNSIYVTLTNIE